MKSRSNDMPVPNPDDSLLLIRCPSCGQRFKVGDDLRERTVECGGCEHRFRIDDEVIVRGKRFYPGERSDSALNRFQRVPLAGNGALSGVQPMRYANTPDPAVLEPMSPQRIIAGAVGAGGMIFMGLLLLLGGSRGGMLDGMPFSNRLLMGGFACFLGILMLLYANPKARLKAFLVGLLLGSGVMAVPLFVTGGSEQPPQGSGNVVDQHPVPAAPADKAPAEDKAMAALKNRIGMGPLVTEIEKLANVPGGKRAMGLWIHGLSTSDRYIVQDYILRVTHADLSSHFYPRDNGDFLFVVSGITLTLQEMGQVVAVLGETQKIYPELSVIEVSVRSEIFVEGSIDKLSKPEDPAFYELNKRELESIDLERVRRATQRLAEVPPKLYRDDITQRFIALLGDDSVDFKANICKALTVWSEKPGPAGEAALREVKRLVAGSDPVPPEIVALVVKEKNLAIIPILDELWFKDPMTWESLYGDLGLPIEATLLRRFPDTKGTVRFSAVRVLGRAGGAESLATLSTMTGGTDSELKILLEQARKSISGRLGQ